MNIKKPLIALTLVAAAVAAVAAPTKKELAQKVLSLQQTALDDNARAVAEQPARQLAGAARQVLMQAVPENKREATAKQIDAEIKKYVDAAVPMVRASANKQSQAVIGAMLEEKFSEDELKQLVSMLESPVLKKFQTTMPDAGKAMMDKVLEDVRPQIMPKAQAAEAAIRKILEAAAKPSDAAASSPKAPAPAKASSKN